MSDKNKTEEVKAIETPPETITADQAEAENDNTKQLQDLANKSCRSMVAVIDAMCQRGAFKGEELSTIGGLRDQCIQVIQIVENIEQEQAMSS